MRAAEQYLAAYPDSAIARQWRALEALSDVELEALLATLTPHGETP